VPISLTPEQVARDLAIRDLSDPADGLHAVQLLVNDAIASLVDAWHCEVRIVRGPRVVSLRDNYDHLQFPSETVTRDARYTRYVDAGRVLRSHTSAMIPAALRELTTETADDVLLVCPGITFRRDAIDRLHTGTPHQLDLWRIARSPLGDRDMDEMIAILTSTLLPGRSYRTEPRVHPYTLNGRQVDVDSDAEWIEILECGLAHPAVLENAGLHAWSGLALGTGLDRLIMLRKGIPDIRLLRSDDPRVISQMRDLSPFRQVSDLPPIRRDLSVAVDVHDTAEDIGDRVRIELGDDAELIEEVAVLSESMFQELPRSAIERLGMIAGQKNLLIRLVIRPFGHTMTDEYANRIRDRVYGAIHQGSANQWST
jgi:phenylalanyl-tRNA synthetase alpha chain